MTFSLDYFEMMFGTQSVPLNACAIRSHQKMENVKQVHKTELLAISLCLSFPTKD